MAEATLEEVKTDEISITRQKNAISEVFWVQIHRQHNNMRRRLR